MMKHLCAMQCKKPATWIAYHKTLNDKFFYCDKHKEYQEKECHWHWKSFKKIEEAGGCH
jgi:hypothetical protein